MRPSAMLCSLVVVVIAAGCADSVQWTGTVTDSAGVAVVHNPDVGVWTASETWKLVEELRIGTVEGDPEYVFGQIEGVDVDSRGRIFVLDAQAQHVKIYSPDGQYELTVGGPGDGPGEIGPEPGALTIAAGDTLFVTDLSNQRINRYAPDGVSLGSTRLAIENGLPLAIAVTGDGRIAAQVRPLGLPGQAPPDTLDAIVLLDSDGAVIDTVKRFPSGRTLRLWGDQPAITVFAGEPVWQLTDDGRLHFGVNDEYRLESYSSVGHLERIVTKSFVPRAIVEDDRALMLSLFEEQLRATVPPEAFEQAVTQIRGMVEFADYYPAYARFLIGPENSLWVQHIPLPSELSDEDRISWNFMDVLTGVSWNLFEDVGAPDWDVFGADGRFLGTVTMPPRFAPHTIADDKIYGVWRDELEVPYAVRLGITSVH